MSVIVGHSEEVEVVIWSVQVKLLSEVSLMDRNQRVDEKNDASVVF